MRVDDCDMVSFSYGTGMGRQLLVWGPNCMVVVESRLLWGMACCRPLHKLAPTTVNAGERLTQLPNYPVITSPMQPAIMNHWHHCSSIYWGAQPLFALCNTWYWFHICPRILEVCGRVAEWSNSHSCSVCSILSPLITIFFPHPFHILIPTLRPHLSWLSSFCACARSSSHSFTLPLHYPFSTSFYKIGLMYHMGTFMYNPTKPIYTCTDIFSLNRKLVSQSGTSSNLSHQFSHERTCKIIFTTLELVWYRVRTKVI